MGAAIYGAAAAASFGLKLAPSPVILYSAGLAGAAACLWLIVFRRGADVAEDSAGFFVPLFLATAIGGESRLPLSAALAFWGTSRMVNRFGLWPSARFALACAVAGAAGWWTGEAGPAFSALAGIVAGGVSMFVSARLSFGKNSFAGEACAAVFLALVLGFHPFNLAFLREPFTAVAASSAAGFILYRLGRFGVGTAWLFMVGATLIYMACGREGFAAFFFFTLIREAGERLYGSAEPEGGGPPPYFTAGVLVTVVALFSAGADDPFGHYFAMAGVMGASIFRAWHGGRVEGGAVSRLASGATGVAAFSCVLWMTSFVSPSAAALAIPAGLLAVFSETLVPVFADREKGRAWAEPLLGAAGGAAGYAAALHLMV